MLGKYIKDLTVKDIIKDLEVISVTPNVDVRELAIIFAENNITGAPVVEDNGDVIGVVSVRDITRSEAILDLKVVLELIFFSATDEIKEQVQKHLNDNYSELTVREIMSYNPVKVSLEDSVSEVVKLMLEHKIRRVIIVEDNKPIGIVSITDILRLLYEE